MPQEAPLMTEDMHEERLKAVEAFGDSFVSSNARNAYNNCNHVL